MVDWDRCPEDPGWVRDLVRILSSAPTPANALPALLAVRELEDWKRLATSETWSRQANRLALASDVTASVALIGPRMKAYLSPLLDSYLQAATQRFSDRRVAPAEVATMPGAPLQAAITSSGAVRVVWTDMVEALR